MVAGRAGRKGCGAGVYSVSTADVVQFVHGGSLVRCCHLYHALNVNGMRNGNLLSIQLQQHPSLRQLVALSLFSSRLGTCERKGGKMFSSLARSFVHCPKTRTSQRERGMVT